MPWTRIISAIVAIPLALAAIAFGGWAFTVGLAVLIYLGQQEYFDLVRAKGMIPAGKMTMAVSQVLLLISLIRVDLADVVMPIAGTFICFYLLFQPRFATIADISASILGLFYGGYLPSYWIRLRELDQTDLSWFMLNQGGIYVLLAFGCIWASDIGSYSMGKLIGRTRLSEISPKKTVEGAIFGLFSCISVATIGAWRMGWQVWPLTGITLGLLIGVASLLGDLTESMMKRDAGVKDSGQLIPGHGGILDRADSYVFTAPLVYYFVTLVVPNLPTDLWQSLWQGG
jgi:phosphatidate cytidylyltransferase